MFNTFTASTNEISLHRGYRLLAIDGSALNIFHNPKDTDTFIRHTNNNKGYNALHLNALYDLKNRLYTDVLIQPGKKMNEYRAFCDMVDRSSLKDKCIVIGDRGYESYNVLAHIIEKGWNFLIRVKDKNSNGITKALSLPESEEFDTIVTVQLSRSNSKKAKAALFNHKYIPWTSEFDYLDNTKDSYSMTFRAIRLKVGENSYRMLFTNLCKSAFSYDEINYLYKLRWGIETSFRDLKYSIGLTSFHSKKVEFIIQEIYARLIMYNYCEMIITQIIIEKHNTKHSYQVNFVAAIDFCKRFFKTSNNKHPPNIEALIRKNILPIRKDRNFARFVQRGKTVSFTYRVS